MTLASIRRILLVLSIAVWPVWCTVPLTSVAAEPGPIVGELQTVRTHYGDTLLDLAYLHDLGFIEIVSANPDVDPWLPGDGAEVLLPKRHILPDAPRKGIVINLAEPRLYYYPPEGGVESYPIGIGREGLATPTGQTRVVGKRRNPSWYPTDAARQSDPSLPKVVKPGPDNPLGAYALDLGWPLYLIHGTNKIYGIGRRVSRGCIRLYPHDIERLFNRVATNTPVYVVDQPLKFAWVDGELWLEAHTTPEQATMLEAEGRFEPDPNLNLQEAVLSHLKDRPVRLHWERIEDAVAERRGIPVKIGSSPET